jgi:serine/threonine protein kinase
MAGSSLENHVYSSWQRCQHLILHFRIITSMAGLIGQRLGQYEIISRFGEGGMASVYRARQLNIRREVAIKVILPNLAAKEDFYKRFDREAQTIAALSNPHIVKVFDYGVLRGFHMRLLDGQADPRRDIYYIVMELLSGGSLADRIARGPMPVQAISHILDQISGALDYAHGHGVVHRDLKPQNVLFDDQDNAFLTDFGISKMMTENTPLTREGMTMGTPSYMSPEQWSDDNLGAWTDIYALGIVLFEMLTSRLPFLAGTPFRVMHMHLNDAPPSVYGMAPSLPPNLDTIIQKVLAKKPDQRYPTAVALAEDFRKAIEGHKPVTVEARPGATAQSTPVSARTPPRKQTTMFEQIVDGAFGGNARLASRVIGILIVIVVVLVVVLLLAGRG